MIELERKIEDASDFRDEMGALSIDSESKKATPRSMRSVFQRKFGHDDEDKHPISMGNVIGTKFQVDELHNKKERNPFRSSAQSSIKNDDSAR